MKIIIVFLCLLVTTKCMETRATQVGKVQREHGHSIFEIITQVTKIIADLRRADLPSVCVDGLTIVRDLDIPWALKLIINIMYVGCKIVRPIYWFVFSSTKPKSTRGYGFNTIYS